MFFARIIAGLLSQFVDEEKRGLVNFAAVIAFEIAFSILGMFVVSAFSRRREYRADSDGARLVGREKMIGALQSLRRNIESNTATPQSIAAFQISGQRKGGVMALLSTHPSLDARIERLKTTKFAL